MARFAPSRALLAFFRTEASGGIVLIAAATVAMSLANSPLAESFSGFWERDLGFHIGHVGDVRGVINDGLMTVFFLVVGLELKRELLHGELSGARRALLPALAAVGGMAVPAFIYALINPIGDAARGWGIPTATDIAFVVGILALFGNRIPTGLKVFILALAIADDLGAIVVIALFYSDAVNIMWLVLAIAACGGIALLRNKMGWILYAASGALLWFLVSEAGIHPTIAGVALALLAPAGRDDFVVEPSERLEELLHPIASFAIVPLFALANAGVALGGSPLPDQATRAVAVGVALALVVGKLVGIVGATLLAIRFRLATTPEGVTVGHLAGGAALAGIGFTVSMFITELAFPDPMLVSAAKIGILAGSVVAALLGSLILATIRTDPD